MTPPSHTLQLSVETNPKAVWHDVAKIRLTNPLVHNITNYVVMNLTANALLAAGASPVMAHALEEVEEMAGLAQALVLNIGTLSGEWIEAMSLAARIARKRGIPIVLDPVGSGATSFRTRAARRLLEETPPAVIRGNASEIRSLASDRERTKGVDSQRRADEALEAARTLSEQYGCVVSVSGEIDLVVDGTNVIAVGNGHPMMPKVTGLGCVASALTAAFCAVNPSAWKAAAHAMVLTGVSGELAAEKCAGPGTFQPHFLDQLHSIDQARLSSRVRLGGPPGIRAA
jgi:hydroxyethylthiazole kinase